MKGLITTALIIQLTFGTLQAQETVSTTGGNATGVGGSLSYTIGQVVYTTNIGNDGSVSQGVQQSYLISTINGIEITEINLELIAYPNPTNRILTLNIGNYSNQNLTYQLYDIEGKLLSSRLLANNLSTIDMQNLQASTYLLLVLEDNSLIKTFRIVKN